MFALQLPSIWFTKWFKCIFLIILISDFARAVTLQEDSLISSMNSQHVTPRKLNQNSPTALPSKQPVRPPPPTIAPSPHTLGPTHHGKCFCDTKMCVTVRNITVCDPEEFFHYPTPSVPPSVAPSSPTTKPTINPTDAPTVGRQAPSCGLTPTYYPTSCPAGQYGPQAGYTPTDGPYCWHAQDGSASWIIFDFWCANPGCSSDQDCINSGPTYISSCFYGGACGSPRCVPWAATCHPSRRYLQNVDSTYTGCTAMGFCFVNGTKVDPPTTHTFV